jgi:hypothetical protein
MRSYRAPIGQASCFESQPSDLKQTEHEFSNVRVFQLPR